MSKKPPREIVVKIVKAQHEIQLGMIAQSIARQIYLKEVKKNDGK